MKAAAAQITTGSGRLPGLAAGQAATGAHRVGHDEGYRLARINAHVPYAYMKDILEKLPTSGK
jgi:hypothetical protein